MKNVLNYLKELYSGSLAMCFTGIMAIPAFFVVAIIAGLIVRVVIFGFMLLF